MAGQDGELLGLGHASRLNGRVSLIGIFNGTLGEPEPWNMALGTWNTLQEAVYNLPYKSITTMDAFNASQQACRVPMPPAGADASINYFLCATM